MLGKLAGGQGPARTLVRAEHRDLPRRPSDRLPGGLRPTPPRASKPLFRRLSKSPVESDPGRLDRAQHAGRAAVAGRAQARPASVPGRSRRRPARRDRGGPAAVAVVAEQARRRPGVRDHDRGPRRVRADLAGHAGQASEGRLLLEGLPRRPCSSPKTCGPRSSTTNCTVGRRRSDSPSSCRRALTPRSSSSGSPKRPGAGHDSRDSLRGQSLPGLEQARWDALAGGRDRRAEPRHLDGRLLARRGTTSLGTSTWG